MNADKKWNIGIMENWNDGKNRFFQRSLCEVEIYCVIAKNGNFVEGIG